MAAAQKRTRGWVPNKKCARCKRRWRSSGAYCKQCHRERREERIARNPETAARLAKAQADYQQSPLGRAAARRYRKSEKGKERRRKEIESGRNAKTQKRYRRRKEEELTAHLPVEVVQPFLRRMLAEFQLPATSAYQPDDLEGLSGLAAAVHSGEQTLKAILEGSMTKVDYVIVDRLATYDGTFSLEEIYDRTREWALLTGSPWPDGFFRKEAERFNKKSRKQKVPKITKKSKPAALRKESKELILLIRAHQPLTRHELTDLTGKPYRSVTDRIAYLVKRGVLEVVEEIHTGNGWPITKFGLTAAGMKMADTLASQATDR